MKIRHPIFGLGEVLAVEVTSRGTKLTVEFRDKKTRKIIAEYVELQIVEDN